MSGFVTVLELGLGDASSTDIDTPPDVRYTLDEIVEAHRYVDLGHKKGNVIVTISAS